MAQVLDRRNRALLILAAVFLAVYFIPFSSGRVSGALQEAFLLLSDYVREHVLLCLVPAMFIAGAVAVFLDRQAVIRYLGPSAGKILAYGVASVSGSILAVCSCTVLPLFRGIYRKGAGIGPAVSFLYSGPAINILAMVLTAKVLGIRLGVARAVGAVLFAFLVGWLMHLIFRKDDEARTADDRLFQNPSVGKKRNLGQTGLLMAAMVGILVFLNWAPPQETAGGAEVWVFLYRWRYAAAGGSAALLAYALLRWFRGSELKEWVSSTADLAVQILPLLLVGVLAAGFLLGRPGRSGIIPESWVASLVGGNSLWANLFAAVAGAFMYFATLTEVPIMQGLLGAGMGEGPALALLLAGPSLSLPSMLVIGRELGWRKTGAYIGLVVLLSAAAGLLYGAIVA